MIETTIKEITEKSIRLKARGSVLHGDGVREFRNTTTAFMGKYKQIEFDFSEVSRIDSAGVEALTESYARSRAAGSNLNITNYADAVDEIHLLVKLLTIFPWSTIGNAYRA